MITNFLLSLIEKSEEVRRYYRTNDFQIVEYSYFVCAVVTLSSPVAEAVPFGGRNCRPDPNRGDVHPEQFEYCFEYCMNDSSCGYKQCEGVIICD